MEGCQGIKKMSEWYGRFQSFLEVTNPKYLFYGSHSVENALKKSFFKKSSSSKDSNSSDNNTNHGIIKSCYNSSTNEVIPNIFRMAAIAPVNIPIVYLMLITPSSAVLSTIGLHFLNQTYNAGCNYFNRAGTAVMSTKDILVSYGLATSSACSMAFLLGKLAKSSTSKSSWVIPAVASMAAGSSNVAFMRMKDITNGVEVYDYNNNNLGNSLIAGQIAVFQTALSRCCMVPLTVLMVPSAIIKLIQNGKMMPSNPRLKIALELGIVYMTLHFALPGTLAIFPEQIAFDIRDLEPKFHKLEITKVFANKGL